MTAETIEAALREALKAVLEVERRLPAANHLHIKDLIARELAAAHTAIGRVLHLLAGDVPP